MRTTGTILRSLERTCDWIQSNLIRAVLYSELVVSLTAGG